jgi:hypothetical protein
VSSSAASETKAQTLPESDSLLGVIVLSLSTEALFVECLQSQSAKKLARGSGPLEPSLPSARPGGTPQRGLLCRVPPRALDKRTTKVVHWSLLCRVSLSTLGKSSITVTWRYHDDFSLPSTRWHSAKTCWVSDKKYSAKMPLSMYRSPRLLCRESHSANSLSSVFEALL